MTAPKSILAAGCDGSPWEPLLARLRRWAERVYCTDSVEAGLTRLGQGDLDLFLFSPEQNIETSLAVERIHRAAPRVGVVALNDRPDAELAFRLGQAGVSDLIVSTGQESEEIEQVFQRVSAVWERVRGRRGPAGEPDDAFSAIIGSSPAIRQAVETLRLIAPRSSTVLIEGPTGSGKELAARALHQASPRSRRPFVEVNCAAVPESLFESELFGHVKGAFTGAVATKPGRFEQAHGGTLFLDEVGELPLEMQPKLLRALQEREVQRVGGAEPIRVDVRIVAATNRNLAEMVEEGAFREDLYYRLAVVPAPLPPLAERRCDIPDLTEHLLERFCEREVLPVKRVAEPAMERLMSYSWPGNVRQLENAVEKAAVLSGERALLFPADFLLPLPPRSSGRAEGQPPRVSTAGLDYDQAVAQFERGILTQALELTGGNKAQAATLLHMKRTTLNARWKALSSEQKWS